MSRQTVESSTCNSDPCGLSSHDVAQRVADGAVNFRQPRSGRTVQDIVRANVFTRINVILGTLLCVVAYTGSWKNALFGLLIVANSSIGIIQEIRAKRTLDRLAIVGEAKPVVLRDGYRTKISQNEVVLDDLLVVGPGDQIVVDGELEQVFGLELDESMLTGESDPVVGAVGDRVLSGSYVAAGSAIMRATAVGANAYAATLTTQATAFSLVKSELRSGIDKLLLLIGFLLVPIGALIVCTQLFAVETDLDSALLGMVAALVPMVPEGLVLLTSIAFAVGIVRLGRRGCLVQELPAIEALARVDTVCIDKTGTLTESKMRVREVIPVDTGSRHQSPEFTASAALQQLGAADMTPNSSMSAVIEHVGYPQKRWQVVEIIAFTSASAFSAVQFAAGPVVVLGAPEVLVDPSSPIGYLCQKHAAKGLRVLVVGTAAPGVLKSGLSPKHSSINALAIVVIEQQLRSDAAETVAFFRAEGIDVFVLSGDNPRSVQAVTSRLDLQPNHHRRDNHVPEEIDARELPADDGEVLKMLDHYRVFGRVTPETKRRLVNLLKHSGRTVAMTGDGVNDILALKDADVGVAMGSGSQASRAVAQIVLLDNAFASLPHVLSEGRRVIGNIERVATLFLTKTVYSALLALAVGLSFLPFPFTPLHITITGLFTIGVPAFLLSLAPNRERARSGFLGRIIGRALPAGFVISFAAFSVFLWGRSMSEPELGTATEISTATLAVVIVVAMWVLAAVASPLNWWKLVFGLFGIAAYIAMFTFEPLAQFLMLDSSNGRLMAGAAVVAGIAIVSIEAIWRIRTIVIKH